MIFVCGKYAVNGFYIWFWFTFLSVVDFIYFEEIAPKVGEIGGI